ncbi:MAG: competence/damage-inducible protein A [Mariprofundaceae bacterium]|nr:competence/damage-inducible protein A [Mariprofundaceae bacterium]
MSHHKTAAILVIGNEVLSGRTREANAYLAAQKLFDRGCKLGEISVVPDIQEAIVSTLNRLRDRFDAVITSGGIGPTHDDITMDAVAGSLGVTLLEHAKTLELMASHYGHDKLNDGRRRMARIPDGARPILCDKSICPGAHIDNVYVLAGVPYIFESQLDSILSDFGDSERPFIRREADVEFPESAFAKELERIQLGYRDVEIGSYPRMCGNKPCGKICLSSSNRDALDKAFEAVSAMLEELRNQT